MDINVRKGKKLQLNEHSTVFYQFWFKDIDFGFSIDSHREKNKTEMKKKTKEEKKKNQTKHNDSTNTTIHTDHSA